MKKTIMNFKDFTKAIHDTKNMSKKEKETLFKQWRKEYLKKLQTKYSFTKKVN